MGWWAAVVSWPRKHTSTPPWSFFKRDGACTWPGNGSNFEKQSGTNGKPGTFNECFGGIGVGSVAVNKGKYMFLGNMFLTNSLVFIFLTPIMFLTCS